jgi:glutaredoxin
MKNGLLILLSFIVVLNISSAQDKKVYISKSQEGNSIVLTAHNEEAEAIRITLKITSSGMNLSAGPTIIKTLPAMSKSQMVVLTPVKGMQATYKYKLSSEPVRQEPEIIEMYRRYSTNHLIIKNSSTYREKEAIKNAEENLPVKGVTVFIKNDCERCDELIGLLEQNNLQYTTYNVSDNENTNLLMWDALLAYGVREGKVLMPVVLHQKQAYFDIKDLGELVGEIKN